MPVLSQLPKTMQLVSDVCFHLPETLSLGRVQMALWEVTQACRGGQGVGGRHPQPSDL